jgi:hypothetical protein
MVEEHIRCVQRHIDKGSHARWKTLAKGVMGAAGLAHARGMLPPCCRLPPYRRMRMHAQFAVHEGACTQLVQRIIA